MELLYGKQNKPPKLIHCTSAEILLILLVQVVNLELEIFFSLYKALVKPTFKIIA